MAFKWKIRLSPDKLPEGRMVQTRHGQVPVYRQRLVDTSKYQKREPGKR